MKIDEEYVPYEESLSLKEIGFDEPCISVFRGKSPYYDKMISGYESDIVRDTEFSKNSEFDSIFVTNKSNPNWWLTRPTYRQTFKWFRDEHQLFHEIQVDQTTEPKFCFTIAKFVGNPKDLTEREWCWENIPNDETWGLYRTYEEAELACLKKMITIIKINK